MLILCKSPMELIIYVNKTMKTLIQTVITLFLTNQVIFLDR